MGLIFCISEGLQSYLRGCGCGFEWVGGMFYILEVGEIGKRERAQGFVKGCDNS